MKFGTPTQNFLARLYYELEKMGARSVGEKKKWPYKMAEKEELFALAADWSRFDPRLLEVLVCFALSHWQTMIPQKIRNYCEQMRSPETIGVIASFIQTAKPKEHELNLYWQYVTANLKPVPAQFYFHDLYLPGSLLAEKAMKESLMEFKQWGFFSRERIIVDSSTKKTAGTLDQESRLNILKRLMKQQKKIQISDYLLSIEQGVSRQQALLDFKALKAKQKGEGRGSYWTL